ncbi:MAG: hypothetical protein ACYDAK_13435 [Candidatus Limnocylindrales bacterium]
MSLTRATEIDLEQNKFTKGFSGDRAVWLAMAKEAFAYTKGTVVGDPKRDDVAPHLALALEVRDEFVLLRSNNKVRGKHWASKFADLIIDRTWEELSKGAANDNEASKANRS